MKRLITTVFALLLMSGGLFMFAPAPASAITKAEARACYDKWNGKEYSTTSNQADNYQKSACAKAKGNCSTKDVRRGPTDYIKITCVKAANFNPSNPTNGSGGNNGGGSGSSDGVEDPAIARAASCSKNNCNLVANYLNPIITLLSVLVGIAVVIGIIFGAFQVITSAGDPQKTASGKDHVRNAIVGLVAYVILYAFLNWIIPGGL